MMNLVSFFICMFTATIEWRDFSDNIKKFYQDFTLEHPKIDLLEVKIVNQYWVELNVKSTDVKEAFLFITKDDKFQAFNDPYDISYYFIGGDIGVYRYFNNITCFYNFFKRAQQEKDEFVGECKKACERYLLPDVFQTEIDKVLANKWNNEVNKSRLLGLNSKVNAFFCFSHKKNNEYECQAQVLVVKKDGTCVATNVMKVKKVSEEMHRDGFDNVNRLNFYKEIEN